ncbi:TonB family protein [Methylophilaceae bacterium]|jgi:protein TonB|nr:TonB family protein [Methylophilaceae bacterium]
MELATQKYEVKFLETIILSLLLHASLLIIIPKMQDSDIAIPEILNVEIDLTQPEPPKIIEQPKKIDPPKPEKKPEPIKELAPIQEKVIEELPEPVIEEITEFVEPEEIAPIEKVQEYIPPQASPEVVKKITDSYTNQLTRAIAKQKKYPKIAQMRQWQGEVLLNIEIDPQGNLVKANILEESRYKILNNEAIDMVKRASPFPQPPEELRLKNFTVLVPISFKLE